MKINSEFTRVFLSLLFSPLFLHAGTAAITLTATVTGHNSTYPNPVVFSTNSSQLLVPTNIIAQILCLNETLIGNGSPSCYVDINVNGLDFIVNPTNISNPAIVTGPATITLTVIAGGSWDTNATQTCNGMCTISMNLINECNTNWFIPNTGVVIPADSAGPVTIILESSVDLINWIPANPGTYGTTTTNRFFRVRATR